MSEKIISAKEFSANLWSQGYSVSEANGVAQVARHVEERDRQQFEAGWRAGVEACAKEDDHVSSLLYQQGYSDAGNRYYSSAKNHRKLTPPAAEPAEEGKP